MIEEIKKNRFHHWFSNIVIPFRGLLPLLSKSHGHYSTVTVQLKYMVVRISLLSIIHGHLSVLEYW